MSKKNQANKSSLADKAGVVDKFNHAGDSKPVNKKNTEVGKTNNSGKPNKSNGKKSEKVEQPVVEEEKKTGSVADKYKEVVEEPAKPLTRKEKVFNAFDKFGDLFMMNIIFTVTCLPIFTIGASFTALYTVTNKMVRNEEGPVKDEYFKAFKSNFKQSTQLWLLNLLYIAFMYVQYVYMLTHENQLSKYLLIILGFEFILLCFELPLQFPLAARYENTTWNIIKNSLVLSLVNLGVWFRMFFSWMFPVALYYLRPAWFAHTWYFWFLILTALWAYICSMTLRKFYDKLENPEPEDEEE